MEQAISQNFYSPLSNSKKITPPLRNFPKNMKAVIYEQFNKIDSEKIISDYKDKSRQRIQTTKFIRSRQLASQNELQNIIVDSYEKKNILSNPTSPSSTQRKPKMQAQDKTCINFSQASKRMQIKQVEKLFLEKISNDRVDRLALLRQTEKFISEALLLECKELGSLFNIFMKQTHCQISDQQFELIINEKKIDIQKTDEILRMNKNYNKKQEKYENSIQNLNQQLTELLQKNDEIEKNLILQTKKNNSLTYKLQLKNKEVLMAHHKMNKLSEDKVYLMKKLKILNSRIRKNQQLQFKEDEEEEFETIQKSIDPLGNSQHQENYLKQSKQNSFSFDNYSESIDDMEEYRLDEVVLDHDQIIEWRTTETQTNPEYLTPRMRHTESQTNLALLNKKFDLVNQQMIESSLKFIDFFQVIDKSFNDKDSFQDYKIQQEHPIKSEVSFQNKKDLLAMMNYLYETQSNLEKQNQINKEDIDELNSQLLQSAHDKHDLREENASLRQELNELLKKFEMLSNNYSSSPLSDFVTGNEFQQTEQTKPSAQKIQTRKARKIRNLGSKISISYEFQKNQSRMLIEKVKSKTLSKFNNYMPVKLVLKFIFAIYQDKIYNQKENKLLRDQDLSSYIYNYFLQQFGYSKITEQRFLILIISVKKYLNIFRVNTFARFMGLLDDKINYSVEEQQKYLQAHEFIQNQHQLGVTVKDNDYNLKYYIPYVRSIAYISSLQNCYFTVEEMNYLKQEVEALKEDGDKNNSGIIDFDLMMIRVLIVFRNNIEKTKLYVINAFNACDLDGNGFVDINEWLLLNKYIEPQKMDQKDLITIFEDAADMYLDEEKNLSFDRFSILCMEMELFSDEQQNKFLKSRSNNLLRLDNIEAEQMFGELRKGWLNEYVLTLNKIKKQQKLEESEQQHWIQILNILNEKILLNPISNKPLLISYKILLGEIQ